MAQHIGPVSRRGFLGLSGAATLLTLSAGSLAGCSSSSSSQSASSGELDYSNWDNVLADAKGKTVTWYGWGGSEPRNTWIDTEITPLLKEKYDVTLERVPMNINDVLTTLSGEKEAKKEEGSIGYIWINGENFFSAKQNDYLWGPFCDYLPNFKQYVDATAADIAYDFGSPVEGYEAPYGKAQMCMWVDGASVANPPKNPDEFLEFCKANAGKVTYPQPGDFTGTAFVCTLLAGVLGKESFEKLSKLSSPTEDDVRGVIEPGLDYLRSLNPYLWKEGKTFPADSGTVKTMYADGELVFNMGYGDPQASVDNGEIASTTKTFVFDTGTVGNTNFMAIAFNAASKSAAMVAINEVLSPELQLSQYETLGTVPVLDMTKLSADQKKAFDDVKLGSAQISQAEMLEVRVAEPSGPCIPIIEKIWKEEVLGK